MLCLLSLNVCVPKSCQFSLPQYTIQSVLSTDLLFLSVSYYCSIDLRKPGGIQQIAVFLRKNRTLRLCYGNQEDAVYFVPSSFFFFFFKTSVQIEEDVIK